MRNDRKKAYVNACKTCGEYWKALESVQQEKNELYEKLHEQKEDKEIIFNKIAELYDYIENRNYWEYINSDFVLEQLADIQQYAK
jgi:hypothetical protein